MHACGCKTSPEAAPAARTLYAVHCCPARTMHAHAPTCTSFMDARTAMAQRRPVAGATRGADRRVALNISENKLDLRTGTGNH